MARRSRHQRERSKRLWGFLFKTFVFLIIVGAVAAFAYQVARQLSAEEIADLRGEITTLSTTAEDRQATIETLESDLAEARTSAQTYRQRYEDVAPEEVQEILAAVRERLDEGLSPERIVFAVSQVQPPKNCTPAETRRFIAKTENYDGANTWVRFNDLVTVTGRGSAGAGGTAEWFDPAQPVTITFSPIGGDEQTIQGTLPLKHSMVVKGQEYRFVIAPGSRSFIEVTADRCDFLR